MAMERCIMTYFGTVRSSWKMAYVTAMKAKHGTA